MVPTPNTTIEIRAPKALRAHPRNSRTHSQAQVAQVMESIRQFGFTVPVIITESGVIVAGHCRTLAAERLGMTGIPCIVARGWTEAQTRAYIIADNRLTENGQWDAQMLGEELHFLAGAGFDVTVTGIGDDEIRAMLSADAAYQPNLRPGANSRSVSQDDITRTEAAMEAARRAAMTQSLVTCTCPHCGEDFQLDPKNLTA